ncbi:MAG: FHA domain-containing protein [Actinobacteria bacterium]|nr:FHA domain-containing protein [Actinomycetota bacterium]
MAVLRKSESLIQRAFEGLFGRTFKSHVQPVELAQKLVKEMEENKVALLSRTYVPNHFSIYLCPQDRQHFGEYEDSLVEELQTHLLQHARRQKYDLVGPPEVVLAVDDALKLGFFGVRAEPVRPSSGAASSGVASSGAASSKAAATQREASPAARPVFSNVAAVSPAAPAAGGSARPAGQHTQGISADVAADLRLARRTLHLAFGGVSREFQQGRIVLGRGRDADLQLDDPNVSRMHAVLYWEEDRVYVKDLGSTNGTFVNSRPVTSGPVEDGDVIGVGSLKISLRVR